MLEYFVRGGRILKIVGIVGGIFGIKLVLDIKDGFMFVKDKIRGMKKVINKIIDDLENFNLDEEVLVILIDVDNVEIKEVFKKYMIENNVDFIECLVGLIVSIYLGLYCCGLLFLVK